MLRSFILTVILFLFVSIFAGSVEYIKSISESFNPGSQQFVTGESKLKELVIYTKDHQKPVTVQLQSPCYIGVEGYESAKQNWTLEAYDNQGIKVINLNHCKIEWLVITDNNVTVITTYQANLKLLEIFSKISNGAYQSFNFMFFWFALVIGFLTIISEDSPKDESEKPEPEDTTDP